MCATRVVFPLIMDCSRYPFVKMTQAPEACTASAMAHVAGALDRGLVETVDLRRAFQPESLTGPHV